LLPVENFELFRMGLEFCKHGQLENKLARTNGNDVMNGKPFNEVVMLVYTIGTRFCTGD